MARVEAVKQIFAVFFKALNLGQQKVKFCGLNFSILFSIPFSLPVFVNCNCNLFFFNFQGIYPISWGRQHIKCRKAWSGCIECFNCVWCDSGNDHYTCSVVQISLLQGKILYLYFIILYIFIFQFTNIQEKVKLTNLVS